MLRESWNLVETYQLTWSKYTPENKTVYSMDFFFVPYTPKQLTPKSITPLKTATNGPQTLYWGPWFV